MDTLIVRDHFEPYYAGREASESKPRWVKARVPRRSYKSVSKAEETSKAPEALDHQPPPSLF